jgi:hypothetical protein
MPQWSFQAIMSRYLVPAIFFFRKSGFVLSFCFLNFCKRDENTANNKHRKQNIGNTIKGVVYTISLIHQLKEMRANLFVFYNNKKKKQPKKG